MLYPGSSLGKEVDEKRYYDKNKLTLKKSPLQVFLDVVILGSRLRLQVTCYMLES